MRRVLLAAYFLLQAVVIAGPAASVWLLPLLFFVKIPIFVIIKISSAIYFTIALIAIVRDFRQGSFP